MAEQPTPQDPRDLAKSLNQAICYQIIGPMYGVYYPWRKSGDLYMANEGRPIFCCQCDQDIPVDDGLKSWREHIRKHARRKLTNPIIFVGRDNEGKVYAAQERSPLEVNKNSAQSPENPLPLGMGSINHYLKQGIAAVGIWIEGHGEATDYSCDDYDGPAWIIYPGEVEALKRGELPKPEDRPQAKQDEIYRYGCSGCGAIGESKLDELPPGWERRYHRDITYFFLCSKCKHEGKVHYKQAKDYGDRECERCGQPAQWGAGKNDEHVLCLRCAADWLVYPSELPQSRRITKAFKEAWLRQFDEFIKTKPEEAKGG